MKFEFSAGGIVFKKNKDQQLVLLAQHHGWVFPKGIIGDTIKRETAALREDKRKKRCIIF